MSRREKAERGPPTPPSAVIGEHPTRAQKGAATPRHRGASGPQAPATPFAVGGAQPDATASVAEGRGQSWKVFALLFGLISTGALVAVVAVVGRQVFK